MITTGIGRKINLGFSLLIFFAVITGLIIIALLNKALSAFFSNTLSICQQFITNTFFEIPQSFSGLLILTVFSILFLGILSFIIQLFRTRLLLKKLLIKKVGISGKFKETITSLNLSKRVILIKDKNLFSFCSGIFSPRIIITTGLVSSLTIKELEAVLLHEKAHLINFDPLKILFCKTVSSMFFFLPIFSELHQNIIASSELLADRYTLELQQGSYFLKSAIKKILTTPQVNLNFVPALANPDYLEIRIRRLVDPGLKINLYVSPTSIITSLFFLIFSGFLLQTPVEAFQSKQMNQKSSFVCVSDNGSCHQECSEATKNSPFVNPKDIFTPATNLKYSKNYSAK